jgi:hypothetical protein
MEIRGKTQKHFYDHIRENFHANNAKTNTIYTIIFAMVHEGALLIDEKFQQSKYFKNNI